MEDGAGAISGTKREIKGVSRKSSGQWEIGRETMGGLELDVKSSGKSPLLA